MIGLDSEKQVVASNRPDMGYPSDRLMPHLSPQAYKNGSTAWPCLDEAKTDMPEPFPTGLGSKVNLWSSYESSRHTTSLSLKRLRLKSGKDVLFNTI